MQRVSLIHWHAGEAEERAERLRRAGFAVECHADPRSPALRGLPDRPPAAIIIDLGRRPASGRDAAIWLRQRRGTRAVPLVFIAGDPEKTARVRERIPDAEYTSWSRIRSALKRALRRVPTAPVVPPAMADYSSTPLIKKLGIREDSIVALLGAPAGFERTLGALPAGVRLRRQARGRSQVILLFVTSASELARRFPAAARALAAGGRLWISWPKQAARVGTDLNQAAVRAFGLDHGFVDYKISAIDATWSGLCFARRRAPRR
jgi:CheY-like chemotaxis protein